MVWVDDAAILIRGVLGGHAMYGNHRNVDEGDLRLSFHVYANVCMFYCDAKRSHGMFGGGTLPGGIIA